MVLNTDENGHEIVHVNEKGNVRIVHWPSGYAVQAKDPYWQVGVFFDGLDAAQQAVAIVAENLEYGRYPYTAIE